MLTQHMHITRRQVSSAGESDVARLRADVARLRTDTLTLRTEILELQRDAVKLDGDIFTLRSNASQPSGETKANSMMINIIVPCVIALGFYVLHLKEELAALGVSARCPLCSRGAVSREHPPEDLA